MLRTKLPLWCSLFAAALAVLPPLTPSHATPAPTTSERPGYQPTFAAIPRTLARSRTVPGAGRVRAPFSVTHVGFSWRGDEGTGVRYRTVSGEGEMSRWRLAPEAHDMEHGDHHYSGVLSVPGTERVQVRSVSPKGARMGRIQVDLLNTIDGPTELVPEPRSEAGASGPNIVTRSEWGADESIKSTSGGCSRSFWRVQQLFVHHTAGVNNDPDPEATMRAIYWYHTKSRGWCDIGYNFVIGPDGSIFEGRWARSYMPWESHTGEDAQGRAVSGAHVADFNSGSVGISMMGNFQDVRPTSSARASLVEMLAWESSRHDLRPKAWHRYENPDSGLTRRLKYISGHRDAGDTACPGGKLYASLPGIRQDVADRVAVGRDDSKVTLQTDRKTIRQSESVVLSGILSDGDGNAIPAREVVVWARKSGGRWRKAGRPMTGADGAYSLQLAPQYTTRFIAVYPGDPTTWESQSGDRTVRVESTVGLRVEGGIPDLFGNYHFPPGTTSIASSGSVTPEHPRERLTIRVVRIDSEDSETLLRKVHRKLDASSDYAFTFVPPETGITYRLITWFTGEGNVRSHSDPVFVVVDETP